MYLFLCIFFVYAFLGWCAEVSYAALITGKFVNRGFLNGPVCPIYGFGVVIVLACLTPLKESKLLLFLGSVLLTSLLELVTGFLLEKIFHQRWWNYSDQPFNIGGYICLRFSLMWGFACTFVVYILHPTILWCIRLVPHAIGVVLLCVFGAAMAVDLAATVRTITRMNRRLSQIDELAAKIKEASNEFGENLADKVLDAAETGSAIKEELSERTDDWKESLAQRREELTERSEDRKESRAQRRQERSAQKQEELAQLRRRLDEVLDSRIFGQRRLIRAFPRMRSTDHHQALERLRQRMEKR
jgi:uncharacterized membrane protein